MLASTSFTKLGHFSRRSLLHSPFHPSPAPTPTSQVLDSGSKPGSSGFDANLIMVLSLLVCALLCSFFVNSLIRCVIKCSSLITRDPNYYLNHLINHHKRGSIRGVDKRALKTFPVVKYSEEEGKIHGLGTECVICLSEFAGGDKVRILPKCHHGFHVKCVDKWLSSHSSCPTCRHSLLDTCHKIIGSQQHHDHHVQASSSSSSSSVGPTGEIFAISIVPLEREDLVRNYRGEVAHS